MDSSIDASQKEMMIADLRRLSWVKGIGDDAIDEIAEYGHFLVATEGEVIHRAEDRMTAVYFVLRGRVQATVIDIFGREVMERQLMRGGVFGLFSIAHPDQSNVTITTLEPTTLIKLDFEKLHDLAARYRQLQLNLFRLAGQLVRQIVMVDRTKPQPSSVAVVHQSDRSRPLTRKLIQRLLPIEDTPCLVSDDPDWQPIEGTAFVSMAEKLITPEEGKKQLKEWADLGRIFIDLSVNRAIEQERSLESLGRLMGFAELILWCVCPEDAEQAKSILRQVQDRVAGWRDKICLVWILDDTTFVAPHQPDLTALVERTFKVSFSPPAIHQGRLMQDGLERIVHQLRGIRIGIALGGGAARGMAHLGVLKALERNGIHVDMIAGTSAGAMTGTVYSYGLEVDYAIESFMRDLKLPWHFRRMPGGGYWYLLYKYRRGQFDPMLRNYLGDARLDQLSLPTYTVTVDLVKGAPVVREEGDAVRAILESINLPGLAAPILGDQEALVDGGLVNNIPADVLVEKGCNFVIASSVTAQLEQEFGGIRIEDIGGKQKRVGRKTKASTLQVILRGQLVQSVNMNSVGVQPADYVIAPDVTAFDLSAFGQTDELAAVGEQTAREALAGIKQMLSKLDSKLFPSS